MLLEKEEMDGEEDDDQRRRIQIERCTRQLFSIASSPEYGPKSSTLWI